MSLVRRRPLDDPLAPVLFDIVTGTFYLTVVSRMLGIVYTTERPDRAVGGMIVRFLSTWDTDAACVFVTASAAFLVSMWSGGVTMSRGQQLYAQVLLFYGSTAVFVSVYRGDRGSRGSDINYIPR